MDKIAYEVTEQYSQLHEIEGEDYFNSSSLR